MYAKVQQFILFFSSENQSIAPPDIGATLVVTSSLPRRHYAATHLLCNKNFLGFFFFVFFGLKRQHYINPLLKLSSIRAAFTEFITVLLQLQYTIFCSSTEKSRRKVDFPAIHWFASFQTDLTSPLATLIHRLSPEINDVNWVVSQKKITLDCVNLAVSPDQCMSSLQTHVRSTYERWRQQFTCFVPADFFFIFLSFVWSGR